MIQTKSEDAVSPVIGVMLMLVVTIIIAAVVAAFAGGVGADAEPAPVTVLNVEGASAGHIETVPGKTQLTDGKKLKDVNKFWGDENGNMIDDEEEYASTNPEKVIYRYIYGDSENQVYARVAYEYVDEDFEYKDGIEVIEPYGNSNLWDTYLEMGDPTDKQISENTVTISCLHGDSLDLSKASVKVYNPSGNLIHEQKISDSSKTFGPGDTITVTLNTKSNEFAKGKSVEIEVLYGEHILVSKELTVTKEW